MRLSHTDLGFTLCKGFLATGCGSQDPGRLVGPNGHHVRWAISQPLKVSRPIDMHEEVRVGARKSVGKRDVASRQRLWKRCNDANCPGGGA